MTSKQAVTTESRVPSLNIHSSSVRGSSGVCVVSTDPWQRSNTSIKRGRFHDEGQLDLATNCGRGNGVVIDYRQWCKPGKLEADEVRRLQTEHGNLKRLLSCRIRCWRQVTLTERRIGGQGGLMRFFNDDTKRIYSLIFTRNVRETVSSSWKQSRRGADHKFV